MAKRPFYIKADISEEAYKATRNISRYDKATQERIKATIREKTDEVFNEALRRVHSYTGNLASSIKQEYNTEGNRASGRVQADAPHAHLLEFGHAGGVAVPIRKKALAPGADGWFFKWAIIPAQPAHPFMKPAIDKVRPSIEEAIRKDIDHD